MNCKLLILRAIYERPTISQRDLAKKYFISLGKVNQTLGFGNKYFDVINAHVPLRDAARTNSLNAFIEACF